MEIRFKLPATAQFQRTLNQKPESQPSTLAFVNVNNPTQLKEKATQRKIRRHVMKDIGRSRRMGTIQHDASTLSQSQPIFWGDMNVCVNFRGLFEAMDMVSEGLMAIAVLDPALDFQRKLDKRLSSSETVDEMKQYTESLSLVRSSITPESQASQYAVIGTIICLAVFDMRVGNQEKWMMHMAGLERIIELGGGVEALESCLAIRESLFITDVLGSLVMDVRPRFPVPPSCSALPSVARLRYVKSLLSSLQKSDPSDKASLFVIDSAFRSASQLVTLLSRVGGVGRVSPLGSNFMVPVCAIVHQVLSLPTLAYPSRQDVIFPSTPASAVAELIRISVLSLLAVVVSTTSSDPSYCVSRRKAPVRYLLMQTDDRIWAGRRELKLWVLVIRICMEAGSSRLWFLDEITHVMSLLKLKSWDDLMFCLHRVVWVEKAATAEMGQLRSDIENRLF